MKKIFSSLLLSTVIGMSIIAQIPTNGLIGYYPFNGNANDSSGNGINGIVNGATLTTNRFEKPNDAYYFNGNNAFIELSNTFDSLSRTIDLWFYANDADYSGSYGSIYQSDNSGLLYGNSGVAIKEIGGLKKILLTISGITDTVDLKINTWNNLAVTLDANKVISYYYNGEFIVNKTFINYARSNDGLNKTIVGSDRLGTGHFFNGKIDDIRIYNRALNSSEILAIFHESCNKSIIINDTITHFVSSSNFKLISPKVYFEKTDSLNSIGGCDSIVQHYSKFIFNANHYTDTITFKDTITTYATVEDTLKFNINLTRVSAPNNIGELMVYPNPTKDYLFIDCGNYNKLNNYQLKLTTTSSSILWSKTVTQKVYSINLNGYSKGTYFLEIFDSANNKLEVKKIVLQ